MMGQMFTTKQSKICTQLDDYCKKIKTYLDQFAVTSQDSEERIKNKVDAIEKWKGVFNDTSALKTCKAFVEYVNSNYNP